VLCPIAWCNVLATFWTLEVTARSATYSPPHVKEHALVVAPLVRAKTKTGAERVERWKLAVNASVESDL
jgi:hypothetical protein